MASPHLSSSDIRAAFSAALSAMYRNEVPAYGTLMELVARVNDDTLATQPGLERRLRETDNLDRLSEERHGAIRLGTAAELAMMGRIFAVMGMHPVGYYDLTTAGVPVHATAFRPIDAASLRQSPFRVFTSLLRLDLIDNDDLRQAATRILSARRIFTDEALKLTETAEREGGLRPADAERFVSEVIETFRWHEQAAVDADMYHRLLKAHRLIADVVSFKGPHINHLTPRTLDIDRVQALMPDYGIAPKAVIEGPPTRKCPILLRQTSFKALDEPVSFRDADGSWKAGSHTARFGEIEQRGIALTPKGRELYDRLLDKVREIASPAANGSNSAEYQEALARTFQAFPDDWAEIRRRGLGYFTYALTQRGAATGFSELKDPEVLVSAGLLRCDPIIYEDFLPVSAAGIFQSNLGDGSQQDFSASPNQLSFEADLGARVLDEFEHYQNIETASLEACLAALQRHPAAE